MISKNPVILTILGAVFAFFAAVPMDAPPPEGFPTPEPPMESPYDSDGDGLMTSDELKMAIEGRQDEFEFPEGYHLSLDAMFIIITNMGENSLHENGAEYSWLGAAHLCAWGYTWLDAHAANDSETMDEAMDQLMTVTLGNPMYRYVVDNYREIFEQAQSGNIQPLEYQLRQQCNWNIFVATPAPIGTPQATPTRT